MRPFDFIITFLSFVYSLGVTHILFAATRMIRHRRRLVFSWPLALWMTAVLLLLASNWLSFWDFHQTEVFPVATIAVAVLIVVGMYVISALVTPDVGGDDGLDMRAFYESQHRTFIIAFMIWTAFCVLANWAAATMMGLAAWSEQNLVVLPMTIAAFATLLIRRPWAHVAAPLLVIAALLFFTVRYYPALKL